MELEIIRFIQQFSSPILDVFFMIITMLGEDVFIVSIAVYIYWCYDKEYGEYFGYSIFTSLGVNNLIKDIFKFPRPIGESGIISKATEKATGYSFPSGHTQISSTALSSLCVIFRKKSLYVICTVIIFLVGFSRVYLGVHYPKDVIIGAVIGILLPIISAVLFDKFKNVRLISIITLIPLVGYCFIAQSHDYFKAVGLYLGFVVGIFIEYAFVNFEVAYTKKHKIFRMIIGLLFLAAIKISINRFLPNTTSFIAFEYSLVSFSAIAVIPKIFVILKI